MVLQGHDILSYQNQDYQPIEDYGVIGNLHTVALVGKNGSIDWCCLPRFDAPSIFAALLDRKKGGFFRISPINTSYVNHKQIYLPETNILITRFLTPDGLAEITDFMPIAPQPNTTPQHFIIRSVAVVRGSLSFALECRPGFNYARDPHQLTIADQRAIFLAPNGSIGLLSSITLQADEQDGVKTSFTLNAGESARFILTSSLEDTENPYLLSEAFYQEVFLHTRTYWQNWLAGCQYQGRWREMVQRSALVLKLLTYAPTGAIVAAPTTSLPETLGGNRNWDYRYTWLRDASFTLYSLLLLGFTGEAEAFMGWLEARCREIGPSGSLQPMYGICGEQAIQESILDHFEGYKQSYPVRIGNGAYVQRQLDIYGELMDSIYIYNQHTAISYDLWTNLITLLDWLKDNWNQMDEGIWEVRGGAKHFTHSRLMCWVAFDRAIRLARHRGLPAPMSKWRHISANIYKDIMKNGWDESSQSFIQYYGGTAVDASSLFFSICKFASPTDPRILKTIARLQRELASDSLVLRYLPHKAANDGLGTIEGSFSPCSFWLAETLAKAGYVEEGRLILEKMLSYSNHLGLYAEEIGPTGEALGNFPQAFTHLALITACYAVDKALNKEPTIPHWHS